MDGLTDRLGVYRGTRALVFGHTGFAGGWLALWLRRLGVEVSGFALAPEDSPNLFDALGLAGVIEHEIGDVRDRDAVARALRHRRPDIVFHLAAQSRVRRSYRMPVETLATNVLGTAHVLEALRSEPSARAAVVVTSDKCYENRERQDGYHEGDRLGGTDAYSASKACAELVVSSYRSAFLQRMDPPVLLGSARAGNNIGGGDWAEDRIVPDCVRALAAGASPRLRSPGAVRPWQHVLDAVLGYILLGGELLRGRAEFADAWNFGPDASAPRTVAELVHRFLGVWGDGAREPEVAPPSAEEPEETVELRLDASKAKARLRWRQVLGFDEAVGWTAEWYRSFYRDPTRALDLTAAQLARYEDRLR
jgi:CDP-glucose 4,6-dehydratase